MTPNTVRRHIAKLLVDLDAGMYSTAQLANRHSLQYETIREFINDLKTENFVHVERWRKDDMGRWSIAVWQLGHGVDAAKPAPVSGAERTRRYKGRRQDSEIKPVVRRIPTPRPQLGPLETTFGMRLPLTSAADLK